jgi:hypothetical protein
VNIQQTISNAHRHGAHRPFGDPAMPAQTLPKTPITDFEISKRLALAIGWKLEQIRVLGMLVTLPEERFPQCIKAPRRIFDYRDTDVIWPIAERHNSFPSQFIDGYSKGKWMAYGQEHCVTADTAAMAVAMAVIGEAS